MQNELYYGDNLDVLRRKIARDSVDLCYIDPPFNSKRNYFQIYNNQGSEDRAQAQAFVDTWNWGDEAKEGLDYILDIERLNGKTGETRWTEQTVALIRGLEQVLGRGSLLAYLVHMSLRIVEIHRVLKPTGSFYLHCDPTASHYLKLVLDAVFCGQGGDFLNEIIWRRTNAHNKLSRQFGPIHDTILFYAKTQKMQFYPGKSPYPKLYVEQSFPYQDARGYYQSNVLTGSETRTGDSGKPWREYDPTPKGRHWAIPKKLMDEIDAPDGASAQAVLDLLDAKGLILHPKNPGSIPRYKQYLDTSEGTYFQDIWAYQPGTRGILRGTERGIDEDVKWLDASDEKLGYPTQKPEGLLERIIRASSSEGDTVLDAYCGCGTTVAVAQRLNRRWIGIDITYQSIALILKRLQDRYPADWPTIEANIKLDGVPKDLQSAIALANRRDDKTRKEFEKWAILTYSNNQARINEKKGGDGGIDGIAYFLLDRTASGDTNGKAVFQVKSGKTGRGDLAKLNSDRIREKAEFGILLCMDMPTKAMRDEIAAAGKFRHPLLNREDDRLQVVTVAEMFDHPDAPGKRLDLPMARTDAVKSATAVSGDDRQGALI